MRHKKEKHAGVRVPCVQKYSYQEREPGRELHNWLDAMLASF